MNLTRDRVRSIGWAFVLTVCAALTAGLALRVNAVKSQVHQAERRVVSLRQEILFLETEFQTRSNQHQLKILNDLEFGYTAPRAGQYIEGERQLASLGMPRAPGAPKPIRLAAAAELKEETPFLAMVSPLTGIAEAAEPSSADPETSGQDLSNDSAEDPVKAAINAADLGKRLARIELPEAGDE